MSALLKRAMVDLRKAALAFPDATEDFPWGHSAFKVGGKKAFCFASLTSEEGLSVSCKLPQSNGAALMLPFAEPTGYGLGRSGWVTATFCGSAKPPMALMQAWLDESFRAVAPKKLHARISAPRASTSRAKQKAKRAR